MHDEEGFEKYLIRVQEGKSKISGATLMPHELEPGVILVAGCAACRPSRFMRMQPRNYLQKHPWQRLLYHHVERSHVN